MSDNIPSFSEQEPEQVKLDPPVLRPGLLKDKVLAFAHPGAVIAIFDTETTGLNPETTDHIIEFAGMLWSIRDDYTLQKLDELQIYIKPPFPVSDKITELTGISNVFLADKPSEADVVDKIRTFLKQADFVAGHNVNFDIRFVNSTMMRNRRPSPIVDYLDTLELARDVITKESVPNYKLGTLISAFGLDEGIQFHSAIDDVAATSLLFEKLLLQYAEQEEDDIELIELTVTGVQYWAKHGLARIYVNTDKGSVFFQSEEYFGSKDVDITRINLEKLKQDAMAFVGAKSFYELLRFRGSK
ncbi:MAG: 3'-5' exonuclease [Bacteroidaceae bacterium]|nr:3'-5' exonuclease [Bacteroidaceae bacterium]